MNKEQFLTFISLKLGETLREIEEVNGIEIDFDSPDWHKLEKQIFKTVINNTFIPH